jgi:hypothetical protein
VLRRKSEAGLREFQAAARREGYRPLPLWLADTREDWTHFPCTLGSLNSSRAARGLHGHGRPGKGH